MPTPLVLSPTFGGPKRDILFVSSGTQDIDFKHNHWFQRKCRLLAGNLFMIHGLGVQGIPSYRPKISLH